jgi:CRISPR-associated protein Cas1
MGRWIDRILAMDNLREAWEEVAENRGMPGVDDVSIPRWRRTWEERLVNLAHDVRTHRYRPAPLRVLRIPKRKRTEYRTLRVPTVTDRVLERAVLQVLYQLYEPRFLPCSYGYRPGKSLRDAVQRIVDLREQGYTWVLDADIDEYFDSVSHPRLLPPTPRNLPLRRAQYRRNDEAHFTLDVARAIVRGKLHNQRVLALRVLRRRPGADRAPLDALRAAEAQVEDAEGVEVLRGVEGAGARAYFACYRQAFDAAWGFERRTRRPPKDPVNALLSLGYTLLGHALMTALEAAGLDPYLGFFHVEKYGRPALALDLVEEFRAPFVDSLVMRLINWRMLQREDFWTRHDGATYLDDAGLKVFLREFGDRLERTVRLAGTKRALSYRKHFEVQARRMARAVLGSDIDDEGAGREAAAYVPFNAR